MPRKKLTPRKAKKIPVKKAKRKLSAKMKKSMVKRPKAVKKTKKVKKPKQTKKYAAKKPAKKTKTAKMKPLKESLLETRNTKESVTTTTPSAPIAEAPNSSTPISIPEPAETVDA